MKLLLITQLCEPEPHFKGILFARQLATLGYEVEVLTGFPNYPGGKIYPGYRQKLLDRSDLGGGVHLTRIPLYPSHDQSAIRRVLNYVSFSVSALIYAVTLCKKPDVVYAYHPPLSVTVAGILIGRLKRAPVVCDIQDLWPDSLSTTGMINSNRLLGIIGRVCRWTYRRADHLVVLSPGFKRKLHERGVQDNRITVIPNWCDLTSVRIEKTPDIDWSVFENVFTIVFAGNLGPAQDLHTILDAAKIVSSQNSVLRFVLVGSGIDLNDLEERVSAEEIENVMFIPQLAFEEIGEVLQCSDVLLVHLKKDPLFKITIPSKIQSSMAAGKPILMAVEGDSADIVYEAGCGVVAEPGNAESIAACAIELSQQPKQALEEMGKKSSAYYDSEFSLESGCLAFDRVFKSLAADDSS